MAFHHSGGQARPCIYLHHPRPPHAGFFALPQLLPRSRLRAWEEVSCGTRRVPISSAVEIAEQVLEGVAVISAVSAVVVPVSGILLGFLLLGRLVLLGGRAPGDFHGDRPVGAVDLQGGAVPGRVFLLRQVQVLHGLDVRAVHFRDHVAHFQPRLVGGAVRLHVGDEDPGGDVIVVLGRPSTGRASAEPDPPS